MDDRVPPLEVKVDHLQSDVTEIKGRVKTLEETVAQLRTDMVAGFAKLREEMVAGFATVDARFAAVEARLDALSEQITQLRISRWVDRVWWLVIAGAMLGVMARGFKWI